MRKGLIFLLASISLNVFSQQPQIIPQPVNIKLGTGSFTLSKKTVISARNDEDRKTAHLFNEYLEKIYGFKLDIDRQESKNYIRLVTKTFIRAPDKDAYSLNITKDGITIDGDTYAATFYGMQTLIQLLPTDKKVAGSNSQLPIPFLSIQDYPRFSYRGMHLDVCRHFFPVDFVKKYIDYLAMHKMNYFHWHLTDDQGWRIEIKKYPELTSRGAYRNGTVIGRYPGTGNDNIRYGGFYTQDEVRDIVSYAAERRITVIPEIEMPGHSSAAIAAYPWLSCFPDKPTVIPSHPSLASQQQGGKQVQETWGVFEDVYCAGKDSTFMFLEGVMDEVLSLFPSTIIHVGGDESPKANWKKCPNCQARIKALGLKDEHELQSYFIQRMEKYLNSKGRTLMGWDEILEGGLAPNAMVMSWRGEEGGIAAANQHHNVVMTPSTYIYFDYSQTKNEDSLVIGGYLPLEKVYSYNPVPKELDSSLSKFIWGAQANVWTEYMETPSKVEYMIFPRMDALSEVLWSPNEKRNWNDFEKRLRNQFRRYDLMKTNYSRALIGIRDSIYSNGKEILWSLKSNSSYTLKAGMDFDFNETSTYHNDTIVSNYTKPLKFYTNSIGKAILYDPVNKRIVDRVVRKFYFNKATAKKATINIKPNEKYPGQGAFSLVNGIYSKKGLSNPDWLGWTGDDMEATIDLAKTQMVDSVKIHTINQNGSWIYLPQYVE
ncbi:MAG: beta-N-acetylhexosaminidase, partial [Flavisolibacter sp.]